jgi:tetratricopeptide (TPR) repeat protein
MLHYYAKQIVVISVAASLAFTFNSGGGKEKASKRKLRHKAEVYFDNGDYYNALHAYNQLLVSDSASPYLNYHIGVCKFHIKRFRGEALSHLEKSSSAINPEIYYYLGRLYHLEMKFDQALICLQKYQSLSEREFEDLHVAQLIRNVASARTLMEKPVNVVISNLGSAINTSYPEYVPLISADGKKLFFTSRRPGSTGELQDAFGVFYEDIYVSEVKNAEWSAPVQLPGPVNSATHDACVGLTAEGENLLLYRTDQALTGGDIYISEYNGSEWNSPHLLDAVVNSEHYVEPSACLSASGDVIIFSSNRPGGFGGKDLYRTIRLPNGKWSLPQNLGKDINTVFDEDAPFIHPDGNKLYFSSKGHVNMGGYDIFRSDLDASGNFGAAINIGYPVNTVDDDIYFVLSADGTLGFFSSVRQGGFGETDIYAISFVESGFGYIVKNGFVRSADGTPLQAKITLIDMDTQKLQGIYRSNRLTGRFIFLFDPDHSYELIIDAEGYHPVTMQVDGDADLVQIELTAK